MFNKSDKIRGEYKVKGLDIIILIMINILHTVNL